jgi:hypothetical protein
VSWVSIFPLSKAGNLGNKIKRNKIFLGFNAIKERRKDAGAYHMFAFILNILA